MSPELVVGEVDRISGTGNGILETADGQHECNLGPYPELAVGQQVVAVQVGQWAFSLTAHRELSSYIDDFVETTGTSREELPSMIAQVDGLEDIGELVDIGPGETTVATGDEEIAATVLSGEEAASYVVTEESSIVKVSPPLLSEGQSLTIEVTEQSGPISAGRIIQFDTDIDPTEAEIIELEITETIDGDAYGRYGAYTVELRDCPVLVGQTVRVAITQVTPGKIRASVASLPPDERPTVGDTMAVSSRAWSPEQTRLVVDGIPIEVESPAITDVYQVPIRVSAVDQNVVKASPDFTECDVEPGETYRVEITRTDNQLVGWIDETPVSIQQHTELPEAFETLDIVVSEVTQSAICGGLESHPRLDGLTEGDVISVSVTGIGGNRGAGEYDGFPVIIPHGNIGHLPAVSVAVTDISSEMVTASLDALPAELWPSVGESVAATVVTTERSRGLGYIITSTDDRFPITVPALDAVADETGADDLTEVQITITDRHKSSLRGVVVGVHQDGETVAVSSYLRCVQRAMLALWEHSLSAAVEALTASAEQTPSTARAVEAERSALYGQAVVAADGEATEAVDEYLSEVETVIEQDDLSAEHSALLTTEHEAFDALLSQIISQNEESRSRLQAIAQNVTTGGGLIEIEEVLVAALKDNGQGGDDTLTPNPFLLYLLQEEIPQWMAVPSSVKTALEALPLVGERQWTLPSASIDEPAPDLNDPTLAGGDRDLESTQPTTGTPQEPESKSGPAEPKVAEQGTTETAHDGSAAQNATENPGGVETATDTTAELGQSEESPTVVEQDDTAASAEQSSLSGEHAGESIDPPSDIIEESPSGQSSAQLRELREQAEAAASENPIKDTSVRTGSRYRRADEIKEYAKARADGVCEACGGPAPFKDTSGEPYLEAHHVDELGSGGADRPDKVVAVCPTCHKRIHYGADGAELNQKLRRRLEDGLGDVGAVEE